MAKETEKTGAADENRPADEELKAKEAELEAERKKSAAIQAELDALRAQEAEDDEPLVAQPDESCHVIRIAARQSETEPEVVMVGINGDPMMQLKRQQLIPVKQSVVDALRAAVQVNWKDEAGKDRKIPLEVPRFPFECVYRDIPPSAYNALRKKILTAGSITDEDVKKAGV